MYIYSNKPTEKKSRVIPPSVHARNKHNIQHTTPIGNQWDILKNRSFPHMQDNVSLQLKKYTVNRDLNLTLAFTDWKAKGQKGKEGYQSAKTRARGQMYADLREEYPPTHTDGTFEEKENSRGAMYLALKRDIDQKFEGISDDDGTVRTSRPALKPNAPKGIRKSNSQAGVINDIIGKEAYIGAHLVKREWGGADNMWNVVAWPKDTAEKKWADTFEKPVDQKGIRGEDPGCISITVVKEDEYLSSTDTQQIILDEIRKLPADQKQRARDRKETSPTFKREITKARWYANRGIESVPEMATGINFQGTITLNETETKCDEAKKAAKDYFRKVASNQLLSSKELTIHPMNTQDQLTNTWEGEEKRSDSIRKQERRKDWKAETGLYQPGFIHKDNVVES